MIYVVPYALFSFAIISLKTRELVVYFNCIQCFIYSKTCVRRPLKKIDKTKNFMTNGSLTKVKSIAECKWSALQYF